MISGRRAPRIASAATLTSRRPGRGRRRCHSLRREELGRPVEGLGLHVLAEGERHRAAVGRVGHGGEGAGQRGQELLGAGDAVEVAADRAEGVVGGDGAVAEVLDLLQHRVGRAVGEDVAGDEQDRQAVDVGERGGGDHVERAGADRGGDRHGALAVQRLGVGDGGVGHALLVVAAPGREVVAGGVERLADAGDVAVAEDRPAAGEEGHAVLVELAGEVADHRLGGGQADRLHAAAPFRARASSQMRQRRSYFPAMSSTASASVIAPPSQRAGGVGEDGAADGEALDQVVAGGDREARGELLGRRLEAEHDDAAGVGVVAGDRGAGVAPRRRRSSSARASTSRGRRRGRRSAG